MTPVARERAFVVALDGPAASGKSTVGLGVARRLGYFYFDTGVLYRALTRVALDRGVDQRDGEALASLARRLTFVVRPPTRDDGRQGDVLVDGEDVTQSIRLPEVDASVSAVSAHAAVREVMKRPQRDAVSPPGTILAGRDIGTVIAPDAQLKVWLNASVEERARRRSEQTGEPYAAVLEKMAARDRFDAARAIAPMQRAADAIVVDTDHLSVDEVVDRIVRLAVERGARAASHAQDAAG